MSINYLITSTVKSITKSIIGFQATNFSGNVLWLDVPDITTITKDGSNLVSAVADKSPEDNDTTQTTETERLTYDDTGLNGVPALLGDGSTDSLDLDAAITLSDDFSYFFVAENLGSATAMLTGSSVITDVKLGILSSGNFFARVIASGSSDATVNFPSGPVIINVTRDTDNKVDVSFNGGSPSRLFSDVAQVGNSGSDTIAVASAGANWDGYIAEVIIYGRKPSFAEYSSLTSYLANKYSIAISALSVPASVSGGVLWLDASIQASGAVATWEDQFVTGNDAIQATGVEQPISGSSSINGVNVITFDAASAQNLLISSFGSFMSGSDKTCTVFAVLRHTVATQQSAWSFGNSASDNAIYAGGTSSTSGKFRALKRDDFNGTIAPIGTNDTTLGDPLIVTHALAADGLTVDTYINGTQDIAAGNINVSTTTIDEFMIGGIPFAAGATAPWDGDIGEIIMYNRALSSTEITDVNNYLSPKWGITI